MKICTDQQAVEMGFDTDITHVCAYSDTLEVVSTVAHNDYILNFQISVDRRIHSVIARDTVPPVVSQLKFRCASASKARRKLRFPDVVGFSNATPDGGILLGIETLVSESVRDKLTPYLKDECTFVPIKLEDAPQPYYVMWVHRICDALDEERSRLRDDTITPGRKRPFRAFFHVNEINATYLFRVPQWKYDMDGDLALPAFRDLARKLDISGFTFQAGGLYGPLLK